jgi:glycosyltransferase involved in cell wall biosynthesis
MIASCSATGASASKPRPRRASRVRPVVDFRGCRSGARGSERGQGSEVPGERIRVLVLVDSLTLAGGGERIAAQTAARLDPARFETVLCATRWTPGAEREEAVASALAELRDAGVDFLPLARRSTSDLRPWPELIRQLRHRRIDVLHAHKFGSNVWAAALGRPARVPVIICHEQTWSYVGRPLRRILDRHLIARASDAFLAVSSEDGRRMVEIEGIDARDVLVVPNSIAPGQPSGRDIRAELGISPDAPVIGAVGRLFPQKAPHVLIEAAAMLVPEFPRLQVLLVGDGPERPRVTALARKLGIAAAVRVLGMRSDVPDILAALDVGVLSSAWEGTPLAVIEYMGAGLPIAATAVGGVPDLIVDGVHGKLVPPDEPTALADAISQLLGAPELAAEMGRRARERQRREFTLEALVGRLQSLYSELLAAQSSTGSRRRSTRAALARLRSDWLGDPTDPDAMGVGLERPTSDDTP